MVVQQRDRTAVVRTSDRQLFKRCRRKWGWGSPLRQNRGMKDQPSYFWVGSGGHFALEDYHGYNYYGHPVEAFHAYVDAWKQLERHSSFKLPDDYQEQTELAEGMLEHYLMWLKNRDPLQTLWIDGVPQVEVKAQLELPIVPYALDEQTGDHNPHPDFDRVVYQLTLDRIVEIDGELWILDYKFYKTFGQGDLDYDQQMGAYIWAANALYDRPIVGAILQEHRKALPKPPRVLSTGKLSTAERQGTTHYLYREAIQELYGSIEQAPQKYVQHLNNLAKQEGDERDDFVRRTYTKRIIEQVQAEGSRVLLEVEDMLNPDLPLYTNMTRDCSWDCPLNEVCVMVERDDDWQSLLEELTVPREQETDEWRKYLKQQAA